MPFTTYDSLRSICLSLLSGRTAGKHGLRSHVKKLRTEALEDRCVLAIDVALVGSTLTINGTESNDNIAVEVKPEYVYVGVDTNYAGFQEKWYEPGAVRKIEVYARGGDDTVTINGTSIAAKVYGGADNDNLYTIAKATDKENKVVIYGDSGNDYISGTRFKDTLYGGDGNDDLSGYGGNDLLYGGGGADRVGGGVGDDVIYGGDGNDTIYGNEDVDTVYGGSGNDTIYGGDGNDLLYGDNVKESADDGADVIYGELGNNTLYGGGGHDTLEGDIGDDVLKGGGGNDYLRGRNGADTVYGSSGNDTLVGDVFRDRMFGDAGDDRFEVRFDLDNLTLSRHALTSFRNYRSGNGVDTFVVTLDRTSFSADFLQPGVNRIISATYAAQPLIDLLNKKVPVVSEFDSSLTYNKLLGYANSSVSTFISRINTLRTFADDLGTWTGDVTFGTFTVTSGARNLTAALTSVSGNPAGSFSSSVLTGLRNAGMTFPIFEQPANMIRILFGENVDLIQVKLPTLSASYGYSQNRDLPTGIPGVYASVGIGGSLTASASMTLGFDTQGFWKNQVLDGFYFANTSARVTTKFNATVEGGVGFDSEWSLVKIGGDGYVKGTLNFGLRDRDGDGKVRLSELSVEFFSQSFSKSGSITYGLDGYLSYRYPSFPDVWNWDTARKTWTIVPESRIV